MKKFLILFCVCLVVGTVYAHGVDAVIADAGSAVVVEMKYHDGEPMKLVQVSVFSPSSPDDAVFIGDTDRNGHYAFVPDEDGEWRVEAIDGMGHKAVASAHYSIVTGASPFHDDAPQANYMSAILGISLILNIFMLYNYLRKRRAHQ